MPASSSTSVTRPDSPLAADLSYKSPAGSCWSLSSKVLRALGAGKKSPRGDFSRRAEMDPRVRFLRVPAGGRCLPPPPQHARCGAASARADVRPRPGTGQDDGTRRLRAHAVAVLEAVWPLGRTETDAIRCGYDDKGADSARPAENCGKVHGFLSPRQLAGHVSGALCEAERGYRLCVTGTCGEVVMSEGGLCGGCDK